MFNVKLQYAVMAANERSYMLNDTYPAPSSPHAGSKPSRSAGYRGPSLQALAPKLIPDGSESHVLAALEVPGLPEVKLQSHMQPDKSCKLCCCSQTDIALVLHFPSTCIIICMKSRRPSSHCAHADLKLSGNAGPASPCAW